MGLFDATSIPVLQKVVEFTEARHGVLAGNIANLDTPGYKTQDLSPELFEEDLKKAIAARDSRSVNEGSMYPSYETGVSASNAERFESFRGAKDQFRSVLRHDEADVSIEKQITEMAKNQAQHNLALTIMVTQFRLLETAISERV